MPAQLLVCNDLTFQELGRRRLQLVELQELLLNRLQLVVLLVAYQDLQALRLDLVLDLYQDQLLVEHLDLVLLDRLVVP